MRRRGKISQTVARAAIKRVAELVRIDSERRNRFSREYPGGSHIVTLELTEFQQGRCEGAQMVGATLVAKTDGHTMRIYAIAEGLS